MWKSKKVFLMALLAIALVVGGTTGIAFATTGNGDNSQPEARHQALLDRVSEIYEENTGVAIDSQELKDAFAEARSEMRDQALDTYLQNLVGQGKITQDEADQYKAWWQAKPNVPLPRPFGSGCGFHGFPGWGGPHPVPHPSSSGP